MITKTAQMIEELAKNVFEYGFFSGQDVVWGAVEIAEGVEIGVALDMVDLSAEYALMVNRQPVLIWECLEIAAMEIALIAA